jgi:hypothetical protein
MDIDHILGQKPERGEDHFHKIVATQKDMEIETKLLVELRIDPGSYSAVRPEFLRYVIQRALMRSMDRDDTFVRALLGEKSTVNSRQLYRLKQPAFKSCLSGSYIQEVLFSSLFRFDQNVIDRIMAEINNHVVRGCRVSNIKIVSKDFSFGGEVEYSNITFRFDSRKIKNAGQALLASKVKRFFSKDDTLKYKSQKVMSRFTIKVEYVDFDKSKVLYLRTGVGRNRYESVLKMFAKVEEVHPLIFLASFLGDAGPRAYNTINGADISIEGFYKRAVDKGSVFDADPESEFGFKCPRCDGVKFINLMSGQPFGALEYEQSSIPMEAGICQFCHMELTA